MSYILDALRRADAERERGGVPGLQSQQHAIADDDAAAPPRSHALLWAVVGLSVALVAVLAWSLSGGGSPPARAIAEGSVATAPIVAAPAATAPVPPAAPAPPVLSPTSPSPVAPPNAATAEPPAPAVAEHAAKPPRTVAVARPAAHPPAEPKPVAKRSTVANAATAEPAAAGEARVYKESDLPEDVRRDLPKLAIGGASYSGDAASRMVMINGQIFHEGDPVAQGLVLERIKLKSAILAYKGYRYEVHF